MDDKIYCPYTDSYLSKEKTNSEHIIPLSLGGINGFEIYGCKTFNSKVGSEVEGKISNELGVLSRRTNLGIKGQSGKLPIMYFKNAKDVDTGITLQVTIDKNKGIKVRAPYLPDGLKLSKCSKISFSRNIDIEDMDIWLKFVAKVALGAGYFSYGSIFMDNVDHEVFRNILTKSREELKNHSEMKVLAHDFLMEDGGKAIAAYKCICSLVGNHSCVGIVPSSNSITVFAGILGKYTGSITVVAETKHFPNEGSYRWGHFICPQNGKLVRVSFQRVWEKMENLLEK